MIQFDINYADKTLAIGFNYFYYYIRVNKVKGYIKS